MSDKSTPLMKQYNAIKARYPGALLLFRVGDFYETFGDDAVTAAGILGITLTKRNNGAGADQALAGFPHHSLDTYLPKLVKAGQRVAICDQLEDPALAKGIVKRGVTELVTPGVSMSDNVLESGRNNYLAALACTKDQWGLALADISTGDFSLAQGEAAYINRLLQSHQPAEVLVPKGQRQECSFVFGEDYNYFGIDDWVYSHAHAHELLTRHFKTANLRGFGVEDLPEGILAAGVAMHYLIDTEHKQLDHLTSLRRLDEQAFVWLDRFTIRNLELLQTPDEKGTPLIKILDQTCTPMGARLLRNWVVLPLKDLAEINHRLNVVEALYNDGDLRASIQQCLRPIGDLERLIAKVATGRVNPREMGALKRALVCLPSLKKHLTENRHTVLQQLAEAFDECANLVAGIDFYLEDDAPLNMSQVTGKTIKRGVHAELDDLRDIAANGKEYLVQLQQRESERTGIPSLKVAYNKVFGYYLEVTHAHRTKVPDDWIRKQTLVNAERYITPELKEYEEKIVNAESTIATLELQLFLKLVNLALEFVQRVQQTARALARLDCLQCYAQVSATREYCKPDVNNGTALHITAGRHPVIEATLPPGEQYIPNDVHVDEAEDQILIITGPNMAGKSALLRQTALIVLLAQAGCFVPARAATVGLCDKIFTRVGASDNLSRGESTFMVEMTETAGILNNMSSRSLVLMDEIGRGTSTYDGVSIAWAVVEHLHNHPRSRPRTLFATHYHELNELTRQLPRVKNYHVAVKESGNKVIFLRKLVPGGSEHSFGIHVARMAGMPVNLVMRANQIMHRLEKDRGLDKRKAGLRETATAAPAQLGVFDNADPKWTALKKDLSELDVTQMSPIQALLKLQDLVLKVKE